MEMSGLNNITTLGQGLEIVSNLELTQIPLISLANIKGLAHAQTVKQQAAAASSIMFLDSYIIWELVKVVS